MTGYVTPTTPERRVWTCKIGGRVGRLSGGADAPMRRAVADAFTAETGCPVEFCFSGWGDDLDESELAVVEDRAPDPEAIRAALVKRLTALPPPEPPAPDDLVSRARGHAETRPESRELIEELLAAPLDDAVHLLDLAWGVIANADGWNDDTSWRQAAERWRDGYHRLLDDIRDTNPIPAPPPAPPWPGAVLSGCVDEDGVPTWLAQAGQVRGEQVRLMAGSEMWMTCSRGWSAIRWVEVRAPRAVPVPETERVPWWEAVGREVTDGLLCVENAMIREVGREGDRVYVCGYEDPDNPDEDDRGDWQRNYWYGRDGFDGTVEVLVEAGQ